jgi:hypothetical protein
MKKKKYIIQQAIKNKIKKQIDANLQKENNCNDADIKIMMEFVNRASFIV